MHYVQCFEYSRLDIISQIRFLMLVTYFKYMYSVT